MGLAPSDLKVPVDIYEVLARVLDGSQFDEYKPLYGTSLVTGWASIHGFPVGILANARGRPLFRRGAEATQFIQLANRNDVPLVFIQNVTGYMVGKEYEQRGIIKHGAMMINAVSNSTVPHVTLQIGASYGAGNYGMCGRAYNPRFVFIWPNSKTAVMGPQQLAGVLSIVNRAAAAASGRPFDEQADQMQRAYVENQIESESLATYTSARIYDDGIIDPRDTRTVLAWRYRRAIRMSFKARGSGAFFACDDEQDPDCKSWRNRPPNHANLWRDGDRDRAVCSEPDRDAPFVHEADETVPLAGSSSTETYLNVDALLKAAQLTGADAVHPGYGFLSEECRLCAPRGPGPA